ncbi:MAG: outer membrane protein transport protein, partial [Nitrospirota bacterium]|nr:outer membrane protein transport protein [Nitrospirota bacterium]
MKRIVMCVATAAFLAAGSVPALATNGYQLIGVGQMQMSMGGAVTAAPMDSMTSITNPAGVARIGERADFSMEAFMPSRFVDFSSFGGEKNSGGTELYGIPSVGWVANAFERDNFYFGGGMYATSGMGVDYDQTTLDGFGSQFEGFSAVQFWKMAPTVAWNQSDRLSFGVSLNVDYQSLTFDQSINDGAGTVMYQLDLGRPSQQLGFGATAGVLFDVNEQVTLGFNYISKQSFSDAQYRLGFGDVDTTMAG